MFGQGLVLHFVLPFGPETSMSREDSVSKEGLCLKGCTLVRKRGGVQIPPNKVPIWTKSIRR